MAQRKRRKSKRTRTKKSETYPGWIWMLFGLSIGLAVAFAVYVKDRRPAAQPVAQQAPASMQSAIDDNSEPAAQSQEPEPDKKERRFTFYDMLPAFEVVVPDETPDASSTESPQAVIEPGLYVLQAGSFSTPVDADRRRAELALHGIESNVQRAKVNERNYYRVYIGPTDDLDELNMLRSRLRAAQIDVLRIRLGD